MQANNVTQMIANIMVQHAFILNNNITAVEFVLQDDIYDGHGATGPLMLIGFLAGEPTYRTTHTVAHCSNAFLKLNNLFEKYFFLWIWKETRQGTIKSTGHHCFQIFGYRNAISCNWISAFEQRYEFFSKFTG
jgi:hypothetical protein